MDCSTLDCCLTKEKRCAKIHNRRIKEAIRESKQKEKTTFKLLVLGTSESGKSTFIRQMRIIYGNGYSVEDKMLYVKVILKNILESVQTMVRAMHMLQISYEYLLNSRNADLVLSVDIEMFMSSIDMYLSALKQLWNDPGIQECYVRRREYQITDSIKYYMTHIDRIAKTNYLPTEADILHVSVPTTGSVKYLFKVKQYDFRMIDVGGQRSEPISEYDQVLIESERCNRLEESKRVFENICKCKYFKATSLVVFFNKIDLFQEKIMHSDLATYYPNFKGPRNDYLTAREFISNMFADVMPSGKMYKHYTCANDTENMKVVFAVVRNTILVKNLNHVMS